MTRADAGRLGGLKNKGERNPNAKLSQRDVDHIRIERAMGLTRKNIARHYGIHPVTVTRICSGKRWGK